MSQKPPSPKCTRCGLALSLSTGNDQCRGCGQSIFLSEQANMNFLSHPCRETCSGWQQGFEAGEAKWKDEYQNLCKFASDFQNENVKLREALRVIEKELGDITYTQSIGPEMHQIRGRTIPDDGKGPQFIPKATIQLGRAYGIAHDTLEALKPKEKKNGS